MDKINSVRFDGYKSFPAEVINEISILPYVSVFIGKNNCGKSSCMDVLEAVFGRTASTVLIKDFNNLSFSTSITEENINHCFSVHNSGGHGIVGNHNRYAIK